MREPVIFHIDVNSAFLSWTALARLEQGDPVDLRTIPSIVGGDILHQTRCGAAKSFPPRLSASLPVTGGHAWRKCPHPGHGFLRIIICTV